MCTVISQKLWDPNMRFCFAPVLDNKRLGDWHAWGCVVLRQAPKCASSTPSRHASTRKKQGLMYVRPSVPHTRSSSWSHSCTHTDSPVPLRHVLQSATSTLSPHVALRMWQSLQHEKNNQNHRRSSENPVPFLFNFIKRNIFRISTKCVSSLWTMRQTFFCSQCLYCNYKIRNGKKFGIFVFEARWLPSRAMVWWVGNLENKLLSSVFRRISIQPLSDCPG
jgi:hypothetical protein